ncbi:hypothetical protein B0180_01795 [Moraxella canis]|uniref:Uncharacterized protein n=1 Tax=Moraxella canis TaxID=90239 RepID=A0A1S9ZQ14_9GAMM|nr:hypothetical protein B0180_01795 [Moraxella canis]
MSYFAFYSCDFDMILHIQAHQAFAKQCSLNKRSKTDYYNTATPVYAPVLINQWQHQTVYRCDANFDAIFTKNLTTHSKAMLR